MNLITQDMTVLVNPNSRYNGNQYDEVYVRTTIVTNGPVPEEYYVPNGESLPLAALNLIKSIGLEYRPYRADKLLEGTENIRESALSGDPVDTVSDSAKLILLSALRKQHLTLMAQVGDKFVYDLTYTYKIFPQPNGAYRFEVRLPFDGIEMVNGSKVKLTVVTPDQATVDPNATIGIDEQNQEIQETLNVLASSGKSVTEFTYQLDPFFVVEYNYNPGSQLV
ncbi:MULTISPECIES: hypothetical protein [Bacillaceae]|uniref:hypothetical protein n=1 Tax=Bacillaceae TaxID=186817 RepID=UPI0029647333|nr:hypothetical protein [Bacillus infantis]MDW2879711.1 hypothetical protein [Bacillus infantis]